MSDAPTQKPPGAAHHDEQHIRVELSPDEVDALREAARAWESVPAPRTASPSTSPLDPDLQSLVGAGGRPGERYVRVVRADRQGFQRVSPGQVQATSRLGVPQSGFARLRYHLRRAVLGAPIASSEAIHERLTKVKALAVLSSDALSSVAYATEQIVGVLILAGVAAYAFTIPVMTAILALLVIVVLSYRQTIRAYPKGGGSYIVASDNLGATAGLIAGCALMTSYTLTVAVSVAAGTDAIVSAAPGLQSARVAFCAGFVILLTLGNLRGIKEAGSIFAAPTYLFIASMFVMMGTLLVKAATGNLPASGPHIEHVTESLTLFLVLKAFSSGATALTGVEAISDGVPAFKPPEWKNARATLTAMGVLLGVMFLGITLLAFHLGITVRRSDDPGYETVISQLAHHAFSNSIAYYIVAIATTAILVLAGNTAFSDFPRLFFFMARDNYAPHQFKRLGDRLAFSNGILVLGVLATILVVYFQGSVTRLIPLYAIGVFTAFTMSQAGMVARWLRLRERGWHLGLVMNGLGVITTATVLVVTGIAKGPEGAWIIVVLVPVLVLTCRTVHRHYTEVSSLTATETPTSPSVLKPVCIVPVVDLNGPALQSLALARTISDVVIAVHITDDEHEIARLRAKWHEWGNHVPLEIIVSPYRSLVRPLIGYVDAIDRQQRDDTIIVVLPEMVTTRWWHHILHNQTALRLKAALLFRPGTVVVSVPYHLTRQHRAVRRERLRKNDDSL